jgi:hypothetical protein
MRQSTRGAFARHQFASRLATSISICIRFHGIPNVRVLMAVLLIPRLERSRRAARHAR